MSPLPGRDDRGEDVTLVNISEGGLLVHTAQAVTVGETRHFRFRLGDHEVTDFAARVVHVLRISAPAGASYAVGLEFVDVPSGQVRDAMRGIATL